VYWHFASKGDLFLALMEQRFRQQQAAALQSIQSMPAVANQTEALARLFSDQLSVCQADPTWPALWLEFVCQRREPELRSRLTDFHRSARLVQAEFVKRLQEQGSLPANVDPATIVELFDAFSTGITMAWLIDPQNINPMHLGAALIRLLWNGLGPKNL
jgi:AcrR family transcriptional regulator